MADISFFGIAAFNFLTECDHKDGSKSFFFVVEGRSRDTVTFFADVETVPVFEALKKAALEHRRPALDLLPKADDDDV